MVRTRTRKIPRRTNVWPRRKNDVDMCASLVLAAISVLMKDGRGQTRFGGGGSNLIE